MKGRILVTGATGFVGPHLLPILRATGWEVRVALRSNGANLPDGVQPVEVGDLAAGPDLRQALGGVDAVVHLAGRAHVMRETNVDPEAAFHRANVDATRHTWRSRPQRPVCGASCC